MAEIGPLARLLRAYSFAYTAMHDFSVSDRIMADDYVLRMGPAVLRGRKEEYQRATRRQYDQFPGLGFTVHQLVNNGERAALLFTEHGASSRTGTKAAWRGISLYRWDGQVLTECRVEQDYQARRRQLASGRPDPIAEPANDPWTDPEQLPDADAERAALAWLSGDQWLDDPALGQDDGSAGVQFGEQPRTHVLDLFSAGPTVAFHAKVSGTYAGGLDRDQGLAGQPAELYVTGIVDFDHAGTPHGSIVTDRYNLHRRLLAALPSRCGGILPDRSGSPGRARR